jgi:glycosyltransferase involved in cell wall biosynthesis
MCLVTIITPTYNRSDKLPLLFESLQKQSCHDFEWLIVDDGSRDETEKCIENFQNQTFFPIMYIKKENGGKHTALNLGIKNIHTILTIIVDSDDLLLSNAIELIHQYYEKYKDTDKVGAFSFLRCGKSGIPFVGLSRVEYIDSYINCRIRENRPGDMAEVFYTDVLKKFPFPEFAGEKFLSEDVVWIKIGKEIKFVFINQAIYLCEYLEGGLTANDKPLKFASPLGSMMRGKMLMSKECGLKANIKGGIIYNCYSKAKSGEIPTELISNTFSDKVLIFITKPMGEIFYRKWRKHK